MSQTVRELVTQARTTALQRDQEERDESRRGVGGLSLLYPESPIQEPLLTDNRIYLSAGEHGGAVLTKPFTHLIGAAEATMARLLTIEGEATVENIRFLSRSADRGRNNDPYLVLVGEAGRVIFRGCIFQKEDRDEGSFVEIVCNGKAEFVGCTFRDGEGADQAINNNGAALNVHVAGGYNPTGIAHFSVTTVSEMS